MKRPILKTVFLALLSCALCLFATGCAYYAPLPTKHYPISSRSTTDFDFVKSAQPPRSEVEAKLGKPDLFCEDLQIAVYPIEKLERHKLVLLFFIIPIRSFADYPGFQIACIEFDAQGRARRLGFTKQYTGYGVRRLSDQDLRYAAEEWVKTRDGKKASH